jgi:7-carboxy-7-deazaguanine synthase
MSYAIKEIYYTLQGEGAQSGRAAVFCRFAACNLWSGREEDRENAICTFCDTDFVGVDGPAGGAYADAGELARTVRGMWPDKNPSTYKPFVVCTGGEPLLQMDAELVRAFRAEGMEIAVETNGTLIPPPGIDWVCVSPKAGAPLIVKRGDELKLVFPQAGAEPELYEHFQFGLFYLQPMDGPQKAANTKLAYEYCLRHPRWRVSLQAHKILGIP